MVSTIPFPSYTWFFSGYKFAKPVLVLLLISLVVFPVFSMWFILYMVYLLISLVRAVFISRKRRRDDD